MIAPVNTCAIISHQKEWRGRADNTPRLTGMELPMHDHDSTTSRPVVCSVEGCGGATETRGWCESHYRRWIRHGDPRAGRAPGFSLGPKRASASEKLANGLDKSGGFDACWPWVAARVGDGYGYLKLDGRIIRAHRLAWELEHGSIPEGLHVCHSCDNPPCCNPAHLWVGSHADNIRDREIKGRTAHGAAVSLRGTRNGNSKLAETDVVAIRRLRSEGVSAHDIASMFGITSHSARRIVTGERWPHVSGASPWHGKITESDVVEIRRLCLERGGGAAAARKFGISVSYVSRIKLGLSKADSKGVEENTTYRPWRGAE